MAKPKALYPGNYWTGTDTNNGVPFPEGLRANDPHFYIGRLGGECIADTRGFDVQAAKKAYQTFGYWDLGGPESSQDLPDRWGSNQGRYAARAAHTQQYIRGITVFLDVELGNGGWGSLANNQPANRAVLAAALEAIVDAELVPGVYLSADTWASLFGADYVPPMPFVLWLAGTFCPASAADAVDAWRSLPVVGGQRAAIWQFSVSGGGCPDSPNQDWNVTRYNGWISGAWHPIGPPSTATPTPVPAPVTKPTGLPKSVPTAQEALLGRLQTLDTDLALLIHDVEAGSL